MAARQSLRAIYLLRLLRSRICIPTSANSMPRDSCCWITLSEELHLEMTATDVIGVEQLAMETEYIWQQIRFRALNLPAAADNLSRRVQIAPLPVIWRFIQFLLVIGAFRWWRKWLPETLRRMPAVIGRYSPAVASCHAANSIYLVHRADPQASGMDAGHFDSFFDDRIARPEFVGEHYRVDCALDITWLAGCRGAQCILCSWGCRVDRRG